MGRMLLQICVLATFTIACAATVSAQPVGDSLDCETLLDHSNLPAEATACSADDQCVRVEAAVCCGDEAVAVNAGASSCVNPQGPGANCRARCEGERGVTPVASWTPRCVEQTCQLVAPAPDPVTDAEACPDVYLSDQLPPEAFSCGSHDECSRVDISGCCSLTGVAVNSSISVCVEQQDRGSSCQMLCPAEVLPNPDASWVARCEAGRCALAEP